VRRDERILTATHSAYISDSLKEGVKSRLSRQGIPDLSGICLNFRCIGKVGLHNESRNGKAVVSNARSEIDRLDVRTWAWRCGLAISCSTEI
jgi:hypothetical protein